MAFYKKNQSKNLSKAESPHKKRLIQIAKLANYEPIPSILPSNGDFNFTVLDNGHLRRKIKEQVTSKDSHSPKSNQKRRSPHSPSQCYLPKIFSKYNRIEHHPTNTSENAEPFITLDSRIETGQSPKQLAIGGNSPVIQPELGHIQKISLSHSQTKSRKDKLLPNLKRTAKRYDSPNYNDNDSQQYKSQQSSGSYFYEQIVSQQSSEYEDDATPGPGYYSVNNSTFQSNNSMASGISYKSNGTHSFGSKSKRFNYNPQKQIKLMDTRIFNLKNREQKKRVKLEKQKAVLASASRKKIIPFLSASPKDKHQLFMSMDAAKIPGPHDYHPRNGIEEELIRKIQRNFKGNFGTCEQRFRIPRSGYDQLGPGQYLQHNNSQQQDNASYFFVSKNQRF